MIKIDDNNITGAYIKELLHTFNLPTLPVWTSKMQENEEKEKGKLTEGRLFIKNNTVSRYTNNKWDILFPYTFNDKILNYTKRLDLTNNLYDAHTHKYLGEYLRFIRDYKGLDLLSLYNCFTNETINNLSVKLNDKITITGDDTIYKIFAIPVTFGQKYTIAIDCPSKYEIFCGFYGKGYYQIAKSNTKIEELTYQIVNNSTFDTPFIFDKLANVKTDEFLNNAEGDLKLFIKLPLTCNSSITVLEGEYKNTNQLTLQRKVSGETKQILYDHLAPQKNKNIVNFDIPEDGDINNIPLRSSLQLLAFNSGVSHPFADKLIEYLCDNVITNLDNIADNIKRTQIQLINSKKDGKSGIDYYKYFGIWEDKYKYIIYELATKLNIIDKKNDILGFIDKDIEDKLGEEPDLYRGN